MPRDYYEKKMNQQADDEGVTFYLPPGPNGNFAVDMTFKWTTEQVQAWKTRKEAPITLAECPHVIDLTRELFLVMVDFSIGATGRQVMSAAHARRIKEAPDVTFCIWGAPNGFVIVVSKGALDLTKWFSDEEQ
ncbi:hypothetical protein LTR05_007639 [Lithohypha guttulata]|uniref:Uncharacterized protein n=1 Tax=Lithohypha guttulata TaxID=1690604 RepID=A0AAN7Y8R0_9EURO|nr:hypothetical protein LTR05_007639 [Lithohypha guttulata]